MEVLFAFLIMVALVVAAAVVINWALNRLLGALGAPASLGTCVTVIVVLIALWVIWVQGQPFIGQYV